MSECNDRKLDAPQEMEVVLAEEQFGKKNVTKSYPTGMQIPVRKFLKPCR